MAPAAILSLVAGFAVASPGHVYAATTINVNTTADLAPPGCPDSGGNCSLRQAIAKANSGSGFYVINVPAGTYSLTLRCELDLDSNTITIAGAGSSSTIINQTQTGCGVFYNQTNATIQDVTISGGNFTNSDDGAGVYDQGNLSLIRVHITKNSTTYGEGGGVYKASCGLNCGQQPPMTISDSRIDFNTAREGGGIYLASASDGGQGGTAVLSRDGVENNIATQDGGGLYSRGRFSADHTSFDENVAGGMTPVIACELVNGDGGGIYLNYNGNSTPAGLLTSSTVYGNTAGDLGGGIYNDSEMSLSHTSINHNLAGEAGGGIYSDDALAMTNMTFLFNTAQSGGGIFNDAGREQMTGGIMEFNKAVFSDMLPGAPVKSGTSGIQTKQPISSGNGGAVYSAVNEEGGDNTDLFTKVVFAGNKADNYGGAIYHGCCADNAVLTLESSTLIGNRATELGGAIYEGAEDGPAHTVLDNTRVSGNTAGDAAIYNHPSDPGTVLVNGGLLGPNVETYKPVDCPNLENPCS